MMTVLTVILGTYLLWGLVLLHYFCKKLAPYGTTLNRVFEAFLPAAMAVPIFTPILYGGDGFGAFVPWPVFLFLRKGEYHFGWQLLMYVFVIAYIMCLNNGGKVREEEEAADGD